MATAKQKTAARKNIQKAQAACREMAPEDRARAQPEGADRARPGSTGEGDFYHVEVRPRGGFESFRTHDVGEKGGVERVAGRRANGSWATQKWLISKTMAHMEKGRLVADHDDAQGVLDDLGAAPAHVEGDRFRAKPRRNIPEADKPTKAQKEARRENIRKAQQARRGD